MGIQLFYTQARLTDILLFNISARNEITRGVKCLQQGVLDGDLLPEDLTEELLTESFQIVPSRPLDLLVRTSGETRLSDFLLWQVLLNMFRFCICLCL
jgi:undecaprenyl diphosphate synthase